MATFEEQLTALEALVDRMERGDLALDESVRLFEEGLRLSSACKQQLEAAEGRIQLLVEQGKGNFKTVPLDVEETGDEKSNERVEDEE